MSTLVLLRHAKADRPAGTADFQRPLTERGHRDAAAAGGWLVGHGYAPDLVLCSPATRARQTWHGVATALPTGPEVHYDDRLYGADDDELLDILREVTTEGVVAVIAHNPTLEDVSITLDRRARRLRTAGIAVHDVTAWTELHAAPLLATHTARGE